MRNAFRGLEEARVWSFGGRPPAFLCGLPLASDQAQTAHCLLFPLERPGGGSKRYAHVRTLQVLAASLACHIRSTIL